MASSTNSFFTQLHKKFNNLKKRKYGKLTTSVIGIVVLLIICLGGVEVFVRMKVGNCVEQNLSQEMGAPAKVSFDAVPLIVDYFSENQAHIGADAKNVYGEDGLNVHLDIDDTNTKTGISQLVKLQAYWPIAQLEKQITTELHKTELFQQLLSLFSVRIKLHSNDAEHALDLQFLLPISPNAAANFVIAPEITNNALHLRVLKSDINLLGIGLPTGMSQDLVDSIQKMGGNSFTPTIPYGFNYKSVTIVHDALEAQLVAHNYPPPLDEIPAGVTPPINIGKLCMIHI